jgi:hypothetical protein
VERTLLLKKQTTEYINDNGIPTNKANLLSGNVFTKIKIVIASYATKIKNIIRLLLNFFIKIGLHA